MNYATLSNISYLPKSRVKWNIVSKEIVILPWFINKTKQNATDRILSTFLDHRRSETTWKII